MGSSHSDSLREDDQRPEEVLARANELLTITKDMIKEINEAQYLVYKAYSSEYRVSKQYSIGADVQYFVTAVEQEHRDKLKLITGKIDPLNSIVDSLGLAYNNHLENGRNTENSKVLSLKSQQECLGLLVHRCSAVLRLVSLARSFCIIGSELILKNASLIDTIDTIQEESKKAIKKKGLSKSLDASQQELHLSAEGLEAFIVHRLQAPSLQELEFAESMLNAFNTQENKQLILIENCLKNMQQIDNQNHNKNRKINNIEDQKSTQSSVVPQEMM